MYLVLLPVALVGTMHPVVKPDTVTPEIGTGKLARSITPCENEVALANVTAENNEQVLSAALTVPPPPPPTKKGIIS